MACERKGDEGDEGDEDEENRVRVREVSVVRFTSKCDLPNTQSGVNLSMETHTCLLAPW
jgi:hypothetical protein